MPDVAPQRKSLDMKARIEEGIVYSPYPYTPLAKDGRLYGFLMERLTAHGSKTALICGQDKLTFCELRDKLRRTSAGFNRQGLGKATGSMRTWAIPSKALSPCAAYHSREPVLCPLTSCGKKKAFVVGEKRPGFDSVLEFSGNEESLNENENFDRGGWTFVKWTTGTTGAAGELLVPNDTLLADWSVCCLAAFTFWILALHLGSTIVISKTCQAVPLDVFDVIKGCKAVTMVTFPSKMRRILNFMKVSEDWNMVLRRSLRRIVLIGGTPPPGLTEELTSTFQLDELRNSYGMSEAAGCMTLPPRGEVCGRNVGFPIPGARLKIIDPVSGEVLGPMKCGEVHFDTPCTATRYLEATTDVTDVRGWIHTGDLGYYDNDGRLFLCGRLKTMLVCQTRKVSPIEIQDCLLEHAAVEEVAVIGVPAPDGDEFPAAVVVTKPGYSRDQELADDLKRYVAERKASLMHLHGGVYFVDALPKNALAKVRAASLRELLVSVRRMDNADEIAVGECIY
ncbi:hypothetical protein HPB50_012079 [Hyalomma asiaticum]|uniref:Uncharacterized protein n=1 Tax=Hyalomma asiaticum TaxID=266040 RepID=A0ACB7S0F1_HYAAI|nr:hypothetical protein HPB50_012079 [Hyalomma asiaticum]